MSCILPRSAEEGVESGLCNIKMASIAGRGGTTLIDGGHVDGVVRNRVGELNAIAAIGGVPGDRAPGGNVGVQRGKGGITPAGYEAIGTIRASHSVQRVARVVKMVGAVTICCAAAAAATAAAAGAAA